MAASPCSSHFCPIQAAWGVWNRSSGESGYYPSEWETGDKERNVEEADRLNERMGVTPAQRMAMEIGSMAGWDVPGADPKNYEIQRKEQIGGMTLD